jgi:hypothetical protein
MMKLTKYLKSWKRVNINKNFSCIIFGPGAANQRKYFENNYCYIDPLNYNIYNFKLVPYGIYRFFFNFIKNPKVFIKLLKFWPTIFFTCALIEKKGIKNIVSLVDYNPWPGYIKQILKDKVYIIAIQNTARHYPADRMENVNKFDEYFLWNVLSAEEFSRYKGKTKLIKFGALKSHYNIDKNNKWEAIKENPKKINAKPSIFLISSYNHYQKIYFKKYFYNLDLDQSYNQMQIMQKKDNTLYDLQSLEYMYLCKYLKNFLKNNNVDFKIIVRSESHSELYAENEILFFNKFFSTPQFIKKSFDGRFEEILKNKNSVYISDVSNLGRECFAINLKTLFFSGKYYKFNPNYFEEDNIFYSINENQEEFNKRLNSIINMSSDDYLINKKLVKDTATSCEPSKENFKYFLEKTGLKVHRS